MSVVAGGGADGGGVDGGGADGEFLTIYISAADELENSSIARVPATVEISRFTLNFMSGLPAETW